MSKPAVLDKELEQYRNLLAEPTEFKEGFGWATVVGIFFCGLVMMPGSIYLGLMTGGSMGAAATWVTVILFSEVMRRAMKGMSKQELVVLLYAAGAMAGGGVFGDFVMRAYLVQSDAIRDAGMRDAFPTWYVPRPGSEALTGRNLLHRDWLIPLLLTAVMMVIGLINKWTLGYFFFRLTSDVEQLPFPLAPISAQGAMAMAEADDRGPDAPADADVLHRKAGQRKKSDRWRLFSLGTTLGIAFGFVQIGVPAITGLFLDKPLYLIPQPWIDTTTLTESVLPATPTGLVFDLGIVLIGMVIPFWAIIGAFAAIVLTIVFNPVLHHMGVLSRWQPGMDTINTSFANSVDFWLSFTTGVGLGIAAVSIFQTVRDVRRKMKDFARDKASAAPADPRRKDIWAPPKPGRGDYPLSIALGLYAITSVGLIALCYSLLPRNSTLLVFLVFFAFIYNPLISYVNARLLGIAGQTVDIPFVREISFILSGAKGIDIWLAPIPIANYGGQAQSFRVNELTGVRFWSLLKLDLVVLPVSFLLSLAFWAFIWASGPIPSSSFPAAQKFWELSSKGTALLYSSTFVAPGSTTGGSITDSQFWQAIHPQVISAGFGATVIAFSLLKAFGLPVMLIYGVIRGLGGLPHTMILEVIGAMAGRYYLQKKYGSDNFLRMIPTVLAGYYTGVGLIGMATIAMNLIQAAVSSAPF